MSRSHLEYFVFAATSNTLTIRTPVNSVHLHTRHTVSGHSVMTVAVLRK